MQVPSVFGAESALPTGAEAPAVIEKISVETALTTVKLSESAEKRLGVVLVPVAKADVARQRIYGGTIVSPPDRIATLIAPVTGTVISIAAPDATTPGASIEAGQEILRFLPLNASDESPLGALERGQLAVSRVTLMRGRMDADARIQSAGVQRAAAKTALDRAEQLLKDKVGSQRAVDEARATFELADQALTAAKAERGALDKKTENGLDESASVSLTSPIAGTLTKFSAAAGQSVTAGQVLAEIVDPQTAWVKVPVAASESEDIANERGAIVSALGKQSDAATIQSTWVQGPYTADSLTATIDLYFEMHDAPFRPGQRMKVAVFTKDSGSRLTIPSNAILYDIFGGAWVYTQTAPQTYRRERVDVLYVADGTAVLVRGPKEGTSVVTDGAAELFGAEFGNDK